MAGVAVVGSINLDIVITLDIRPAPGETVLGTYVSEVLGGKGANQAVAAASHTATSMIGAVGSDITGQQAESELIAAGVCTKEILKADLPTGRAYIDVTPDGENSIIVIALANTALGATHVTGALDRVKPQLVLCQLEVPLKTIEATAQWCVRTGTRFVLNPSPITELPTELIQAADPLIVNRHEGAALAGIAEASPEDITAIAQHLAHVARSVVITDGPRGAVVISGGETYSIAAPRVNVVDTTGAGDVFAGTLAARLVEGDLIQDALKAAVTSASEVVQLARADR